MTSSSPLSRFQITVADEPGSTIPEPTTVSLLSLGLLGMGMMARRRKNR
jgi:hypothetical protein